MNRFDWIVKLYNENNLCSQKILIGNRTEKEAENEVENEIRDAADWTMVKTNASVVKSILNKVWARELSADEGFEEIENLIINNK